MPRSPMATGSVDVNCLNCSLDRSACGLCKTADLFYLNMSTNICWHISQVPNGFGIDLAFNRYDACADLNCKDCLNNIAICVECKTENGYFMNPNTSLCQLFSTAPDGVGADLTLKSLQPCSWANCQLCKPDRTFCDKCNTVAGYYKNESSISCQHISTANDYFGVNPATWTYTPCQVQNCQKCLNDYTVCTTCDDMAGFYWNVSSSQCWHISQVPNGYGVDIPLKKYAPCSDLNCKDCLNNIAICVECKTENGYFMNPNTSLCQHFSTSPDGVGADLTLKSLQPCSWANCQLCKPDRTFCDKCNTVAGYYKNESSISCQHISTANDYFGVNPATWTYTPCQVQNCQKCLNDYTVCTTCDDTAGFYWNVSSSQCWHISQVPNGFGVDIPLKKYAPCSDLNCKNCLNNIAICVECKTENGYFMNPNTSLCQHFSTSPDGVGADLTLKSLQPCSLTNCQLCKPDRTFCDKCTTASGFYKNESSNSCQHISTANDFFGIRSSDSTYQQCALSNCRQCLSDYTICTLCNTVNGYYLNTSNAQCWHLSQVPNGFGIDLAFNRYDACTDLNCKNCLNNIAICVECKTENGYFMNPNTSLCQHFSTAPDGVGADLTLKSLQPCSWANCQLCKPDRTFCDKCNTVAGYYKNESSISCQHISTANDYFGVNPATWTYTPCQVQNCQKCLNDYTVCTTCDDTTGFYWNVSSSQCWHISQVPNGFGVDIPLKKYAPCSDLNCKNCLNNIAVCVECKTENGYFMNPNTSLCQHFSTAPDGVGADLTLKSLQPCSLTNCQLCKPDRTFCDKCTTASGYYKNESSNSCQHISTANDFFGIRSSDSTYQQCALSNCRQCLSDYTICTLCNTVAGYYKNTSNNLCIHTSAIDHGLGANLLTNVYEGCTDGFCEICAANKAVCNLCKTAAGYYLNTTSGLCQHISTFADFFGVNTISFVIESCTDQNCQKCAADKNVCTQCRISNFYYMNTSSHLCQLRDTFEEGYGANLVNYNAEPCQDSHCRDCRVDRTICAKCNDTAAYYKNTTNNLCQHNSTVAIDFGANLTSFNYERCVDPFCKLCVYSNSVCNLCHIENGYNMNLTTKLCQLWPTTEDGYGVNSVTNQLEPCTDQNCQKCAADKNVCTQCWTSRQYYMNKTTEICLALNESNPGFRIAEDAYYEPCDDPHCKDCQASKSNCVLCQTNNSYFMNTTSKKCEINTTQPDGFGVDVGNFSYRACEDTHCQTCIKNYSNCTKCNETAAYFFNLTTLLCQSNETRAKGYRINETGHYERCSIKYCDYCEKKRDVCTYCDPGRGFYLIDNLCVMFRTNSSVSQTSMYSPSSSKATITFGESVGVDSSWADQLDIILLDLNANKSYTNKSLFKLIPRGTGFEVKITLEAFIERARLYIRKPEIPLPPLDSRRLQLSSIADSIFPIVVENFTLLNEAAQKAAAETAAAAADQMGSQRTVANVVLMNVNMNAATLLDRLIADYEYQALIGKQNLTYTRLLLDPALEVKLAPFELPGTDQETKEGYIERTLSQPNCKVQYFYFRNGVKCGLFENYGSDFVTLLGFLAVAIIVMLIGKFLRKKKYIDDEMKEPFEDATIREILKYQVNTLACKLTITFGLQFFFVKMEANAIKLLLFSLLNIYKMDGTWQMSVGFSASIIILIYYGVYLYLAWSFARHLKKAIIDHVKKKQEESNFRPGPLKESLKIHNIRFGFMGKPYEELRNDLNFFEIYHPVVLMIRDILITSSIVLLTGAPHITPILTCIVEICLLFYCSLARARAKKIENALDVFNCICRIAYSLMAALTFRYDPIPPILDMIMFLTLLLNTVGSLFITICIMLLTVYDILVLLFKKSAFQGRYKTSEERIKDNFGKTVLKYRKEFLLALQRNPETFIKRDEAISSAKDSVRGEVENGSAESKEPFTEDKKTIEKLDSPLSLPLDSPDNRDAEQLSVKEILIAEKKEEKIEEEEDRYMFSGRNIEQENKDKLKQP
jgi:hypothetical protein